MAHQKLTKTETVKGYLDKLGWDATPSEIVGAMQQDGKEPFKKEHISVIKATLNRKAKSQRQRLPATNKQQSQKQSPTTINLEVLRAGKTFIQASGGIENAKELLGILEVLKLG